jgi:hypothetical protein
VSALLLWVLVVGAGDLALWVLVLLILAFGRRGVRRVERRDVSGLPDLDGTIDSRWIGSFDAAFARR